MRQLDKNIRPESFSERKCLSSQMLAKAGRALGWDVWTPSSPGWWVSWLTCAFTLYVWRRKMKLLWKDFCWLQTRWVGHCEAGQLYNMSIVCEEETYCMDWCRGLTDSVVQSVMGWGSTNTRLQANSQHQQTPRHQGSFFGWPAALIGQLLSLSGLCGLV